MLRTNKFIKVLISFAIFALLFSYGGISKAADGSQDQSNETTAADGSLTIQSHQRIGQTFKPTMNKLTMIVVYIKNAAGTLDCYIRQDTLGAVLTHLDGQTAINGWNSFDIDNVDVVPGQEYSIFLLASSNNPQWSYTGNNYASGIAVVDSNPVVNKDFGFKTYGLNIEEPDSAPAEADQTGVSTTSAGTAPSQNISADINAPTDLEAKNTPTDEAVAVTLNWTASTTEDIDGYKVFRKGAEEDAEFSQVAQTEKSVVTFIDNKVEENTDYVYMVRSYNGNQESENSNEAFLTVSKSKSKTLPQFASVVVGSWYDWLTEPIFLAFFGVAAIAILGFVLWYLIHRRKKKQAEASQDQTPQVGAQK